jgi:hypothetical protein
MIKPHNLTGFDKENKWKKEFIIRNIFIDIIIQDK